MPQPDFAAAREYALARLAELSERLCYHSISHTRDDVVPAVARLAEREGVFGDELSLLLVAAYFHDIGFIEVSGGHELAGVAIARTVLPAVGFSPGQTEQIGAMIMATRLPQTPRDHLGAILADADLDILGRSDFLSGNARLRAEQRAFGVEWSDADWYRSQLTFLTTHSYFSPAARQLRQAQKERNIATLAELLRRAHGDCQTAVRDIEA